MTNYFLDYFLSFVFVLCWQNVDVIVEKSHRSQTHIGGKRFFVFFFLSLAILNQWNRSRVVGVSAFDWIKHHKVFVFCVLICLLISCARWKHSYFITCRWCHDDDDDGDDDVDDADVWFVTPRRVCILLYAKGRCGWIGDVETRGGGGGEWWIFVYCCA